MSMHDQFGLHVRKAPPAPRASCSAPSIYGVTSVSTPIVGKPSTGNDGKKVQDSKQTIEGRAIIADIQRTMGVDEEEAHLIAMTASRRILPATMRSDRYIPPEVFENTEKDDQLILDKLANGPMSRTALLDGRKREGYHRVKCAIDRMIKDKRIMSQKASGGYLLRLAGTPPVEIKRGEGRGKPVTFEGVEYPSIAQAAEARGCSPNGMKAMIRRATAAKAPQAITMPKNTQRASGGPVSRGNGQLEGRA